MNQIFPKEGILAALALPTDAQGQLCVASVGAHLAWLREKGIHGVLALGSTGEFPFFTIAERIRILTTVKKLAAPLPVIANISDINPKVVQQLGRAARDLELAAVAVMPPSFFPVSDEDQLAFFLAAAEAAAPLPVMLYNFPELTGNRIALETVAAFADRASMAGIKQSGGEFAYHTDLIALGQEKDFSVYSGSDTRLPEVFEVGGSGCIGGLVNIVPELMLEQFRVFKRGEPGELEPTGSRMKEVGAILGKLTFPLNVPAGIAARGFDPGVPKAIVSDSSKRNFDAIVTALKGRFKNWGLPPHSPDLSTTPTE